MCGIFGYFDRSGTSLSDATLSAMGAMLQHRGPDEDGIWKAPGVGLGNQRLSIIDIEGGHQPFISDDGRIVVVQNGEIYNYVELAEELAEIGFPCRTHSDTEVLLRLYECYGIGFLSRLNGMFAIAIYDRGLNAVFVARDRVGVKPLYYRYNDRQLLFASEIKSLLRAGGERRVDPAALHLLLQFNYVPPQTTIFAGVEQLQPGHFLRIDDSGLHTECWWRLPAQRAEHRTEAAWIEEIHALLDDAVRIRLRSDVEPGAFLSGGIDSSTVTGLMARHHPNPVRSFSIGFDDPKFDETPYAMEAAERFHTAHTAERVDPNMIGLWPRAIWHCDQPHGDVSFMPTYRVSSLAARHVKMVLTGDGGDELFAGYEKYQALFDADAAEPADDAEFARTWLENFGVFDASTLKPLYTSSFAAATEGVESEPMILDVLRRAPEMDRINQALMLDVAFLLPGNNLVKPDRMGMANSLEARTPFLDYRLVEAAFRIPGDLKLRNGETKYILKRAFEGLIGKRLTYRRKQMFTVPIGNWLSGPLAGFAADILLSDRATDRGYFSAETVARLLDEHRRGIANHTRALRLLIAIELWHRCLIDDLLEAPPTLEELGIATPVFDTVPA